ncbi:MAG TPA: SIMPL domain-containing protein [Firmicutes bacterium]|nr:SIMPL domain-containing protein [Bacillota bacterium]
MKGKTSLFDRVGTLLVIILAMMATPVFAADADCQMRVVKTKGEAEVPGQPIGAHMDVTVSITEKSADKARNEVAKRVAAIKQVLLAEGLSEDDLRTNTLSMSTNTHHQTGEITGYTTKHTLSIVISDIDKLGIICAM